MSKQPTSYRLSPEGLRLLDKLSRLLGVSRTGVLELLIRERARQERVAPSRKSRKAKGL